MDDQRTDIWRKISVLSGLIAAVVIPIVVAITGNMFSQAIKEREIEGRFVELAVSILKEQPEENSKYVRIWAIDIIDRYSGVPLNINAKAELEKAPLLNPAEIIIFDNANKEDVLNFPKIDTKFEIKNHYIITSIRTYHWNNGDGATPTNIRLKSNQGLIFGPWEVSASPGYRGAPNVNWYVFPNIVIPPGVYIVEDGEPETWSYNEKSKKMGFATIKGKRVSNPNR